MRVPAKFCAKMMLVVAVLLATATWSRANEAASATFTVSTVSPGVFQYDLTLTDTGTTTIGTFWFSWIPGAGLMPVAPTGVVSPAGWSDILTNGNGAIQWTNSTPLSAGSSVSGFEFDSTLTLAQLEASSTSNPSDPVDTFFTYSGAPFSDAGFQGVAAPAAANTPEPATFVLLAGALGLLAFARRFRGQTHTAI
jgi:PEP-CTERM motif